MGRVDPMNQYRCLVKHFFGRFFDLEAIAAPQVERNVLLVQVFALLALPGALRSPFPAFFIKYKPVNKSN